MVLGRPALTATLAVCLGGAVAAATGLASDTATKLKGKAEVPETGLIQPGAAPVPFQLPDLDEETVSLADYAGKKAVLVVFWSFFCGPCREEIPLLDEIGKKYQDQGFEVLAINLDGPKLEKAVRKYMSSNNFTFRVLWEKLEGIQYVTADAYGVAGTPSIVLIGKDGKVTWSHVGREEPQKIEEQVRKALGS